jgi:hypothetical protein
MSVPANAPAGRQIFRVAALQRHAAGSEQTVLPALGGPRRRRLLWLALALLTWLVVVGAMMEVPVVVKGQAAVSPGAGAARCPSGRVCVVLFVPPADRARVRVGQRVVLSTGSAGLGGTVVEVQPAVLATLDPPAGGVTAEPLAGAFLPASVSVGKRQLFRFVDRPGPPLGGRP